MILTSIGILFLIFIINVIPAFMPPTWMLLSFVGFTFHFSNYSLVIFSVFAAIAAVSGRAILALFSDRIIRNRFLSNRTRENIDIIKINIEKRKVFLSGFFLLFAFSPFPSGQLFLAYGLTGLKLRFATIPFFIGRLVSYLFWAFTASEISERLVVSDFKSGAFFSLYFILAQLGTLFLVYLFAKVDWKILFEERKIRFLKKEAVK
jgi:hypothetical protein